MPKSVYLNIDWDYFVREKLEWDWGHSEGSSIFSDVMWHARAIGFAMQGVDLDVETDPIRHSFPKPGAFAKFLTEDMGMVFDPQAGYDFVVGDSHGYAPQFYSGQDMVINFDAHHDCGYHPRSQLREWVKHGNTEAGSWLWRLLNKYPKLQAQVMYPRWKGWADYEGRDFTDMLEDNMWDRLTFDVVEDNMDWSEYHGAHVTGVYIARSGAWTPPWTDEDFVQFVYDFYRAYQNTKVRGNHNYGPDTIGHDDVLTPREFDWDAVEQVKEQHQVLLDKVKERTRANMAPV